MIRRLPHMPNELSNLRERSASRWADLDIAEAGGLMAYAVDLVEMYRHAAVFVDKLLKGAKPYELPVEQPTKFKFVINLKAAKALGLTIPNLLFAQADEVIE